MKRILLTLACLTPLLAFTAETKTRDVVLDGTITGENVTFTLKMGFDELLKGGTIKLVEGPVALLSSVLPPGTEIQRNGHQLTLVCVAGRSSGMWSSRELPASGTLSVTFAVRAAAMGDWRRSEFAIPVAPIRPVSITGDRPDLEVRIDGARDIKRTATEGGRSRTVGFLGQEAKIAVSWKTEIRQLDAELMASCEVTTVGNISAGALRLKTLYKYQIAQGALNELLFDVPDVTITQVGGADIQDWRVDKTDPKAPQLHVTLGRPQRENYALMVECERPLPAFPCTLPLAAITPRQVIRAGGTLLLGTDSAIRIQPANPSGLTQTDPTTFPRDQTLPLPQRSLFTYQYATMPYGLSLSLDNIVPALDSEVGVVVNIREGELTVETSVQIEVRDAPVREIKLLVDADARWTVTAVTGPQVAESDVDIRAVDGGREIIVPFRQPVSDTVALRLRLEHPFAANGTALLVPRVSVPTARTQRGYIVAAADKGLRLTPKSVTELRDVHTASTPVRIEGAQLAYRFREIPWKLEIGVERAKPAIHSEVFHLVSLGEGVMYVSAAITCHISGAPVQQLRFRVPPAITAIDVIGAGIDNWSRSNDVCTVSLANRTMGDYTLLITYDQPLNYRGADLRVGDIETLNTDSEMGYIAVATSAGLKLDEKESLPPALIRIARDELPPGYAATVSAPVIGAYKYVRSPHAATLRITPLDSARVIDQVVDYLALTTIIGRNGESQTRALYCIKNASRQYLSVKLPAHASLWYVRQLLPEGQTRDLASQQTADVLLVPVDRPRDPNQAVSIEITYSLPGQPGRHLVPLTAPSLPESQVTYASWEIAANDKLAIGETSGNMTPSEVHAFRLPVADGGRPNCRFYRTANLTGDEPLHVNVLLVPFWMAGGSMTILMWGGALGVLLLLVAVLRRQAIWWAMALTALGVAAVQTTPGVECTKAAVFAGVPLLLLFISIRGLVQWSRRPRPKREPHATPMAPEEPPPLVPEPPEANPQSGAVACRTLLALAFAAVTALTALAAPPPAPPATPPLSTLQAQKIEISVQAPALDRRAERVAAVTWKLHLVAIAPGRYHVLDAGSVLVRAQTPAQTQVKLDDTGYLLEVFKTGTYDVTFETREGVAENEGRFELTLPLPSSLMNQFALVVPAADMEITSEQTVSLNTSSAAGETRATGVLDTSRAVTLAWRPRARVTRLEQAVVYCDVESVAFARAGVIDITARANYQVVQGEIRELKLRIPPQVSVTSVSAPALATWSLDPATRQLVAILARPVSDPFTLVIGLQAPCSGMPYNAAIGVPVVENVQRQRGLFALAAPEAILLRLGEVKAGELEGVTPINTSDFPVAGNEALIQALAAEPMRRAFRYDDPALVRIALRAEPVQPEVRVTEKASFSVGDERNVLSSVLELHVAKAGIFSVKLQLPEGYDIETLTGRDVSHWDDTRRTGQGVEVFFKRRVLGSTTLNLALTRTQRGIPEQLVVPRVAVQDANRHTGYMAVSGERGVRLTVDEQQGVSVRKTESGEKVQPAALAFDILRPSWQVSLHTQVMAPVLKPEVLHRVELAEGMLQHRIYIAYRIENAGVKIFRLRVPVKDATLSVSGRNIARAIPLDNDPEAGSGRVWQVELHGKVEDKYVLTCFYQQPYDPASGGVTINAFDVLSAARQTAAWLVVTGGGRVQVEPRGETEGLQPEDARGLPDTFGAGDLSGAIRCYRVLRPDYRCDFSVVRHNAAAVLPASVEKAQFVTVLSSSGKMLTQATIDLKVGDLRFLKLQMPSASGSLWAALVNGAVVRTSRDGETINIPLENLTVDRSTSVMLIYSDTLEGISLSGRRMLQAPRFPDVPLRDITWTVYVPPEFQHKFLTGDFDKPTEASWVKSFGKDEYEQYNKAVSVSSIGVAKNNMKLVGSLLDSGRQKEAQQALQLAVNASQADQTLNEDARIQFRNVAQQQVKMGLVNRRQELRVDNNIFDEQTQQANAGFNNGNYNQQFVAQVEEQLTAPDRAALDRVAKRIVDQQAAAAGQGAAINIAMPLQGRELRFYRSMQGEKGGTLKLVLQFDQPAAAARVLAFWPAVAAFLALWGVLKLLLMRKA
ncbi:MAG: hypothetical protein ACOYOU_10580 [Kiritimatiellia bacterium]